jgi:hypothetical protein
MSLGRTLGHRLLPVAASPGWVSRSAEGASEVMHWQVQLIS